MSESILREVFMAPVTEVLEEARRLASFYNSGKRQVFVDKVNKVEADIRLLVEGRLAVQLQDSDSPMVRHLQSELASRDKLLNEYGSKIAQANRDQNTKESRLLQRIEELERQVAGKTPKQAQLDKATGRLRLARELVQDLRRVVVPLAQQLEHVRGLVHELAEVPYGVQAVDLDRLLNISRLLVNEADASRPEADRKRDEASLSAIMASHAEEDLPVTRGSIQGPMHGEFRVRRVGKTIGQY